MKKTLSILSFFLIFLSTAPQVRAEIPLTFSNFNPESITGRDWQGLSRLEKGLFVFQAVQALKAYGVPLSQAPAEYTEWMDEVVMDHPAAMSVKAKNLLAAVIYENEPDCREALDRLKE